MPVVLVTGFLGAGKTTLVNHMLAHPDGRRIAAVVNDFGAINIDAELIEGAADGVVSLANGCICCSLEGDLLRTLAALLRRDPRPDAIVVETSGIADPAAIVRSLMDPVVWRDAPLDTVLCVVDATRPDLLDDALLQAQVRAADVLVMGKCDRAGSTSALRARLAALKPAAVVVEAVHGAIPAELLFSPDERPPRPSPRSAPVAHRFESLSWTSDTPVSLPRFQAALGRLAPHLVRAKGVIATVEHPGRPLLLQLVGGRATLAPAPLAPATLAPATGEAARVIPPVRLVAIAEIGRLDRRMLEAELDDCRLHTPAK